MRSETIHMKKMNKKGFTLAELLIVVAIIAVLVAIAIPVFTSQLEKSRVATDEANIRSAYGEAVAAYLSDPDTLSGSLTLNGTACSWSADATTNVVTVNIPATMFKSTKYKSSAVSYDGTTVLGSGT